MENATCVPLKPSVLTISSIVRGACSSNAVFVATVNSLVVARLVISARPSCVLGCLVGVPDTDADQWFASRETHAPVPGQSSATKCRLHDVDASHVRNEDC